MASSGTSALDVAARGVAQQNGASGVVLPPGFSLPATRRTVGSGWLTAEARAAKRLLYVADQAGGAIRIYRQKGTNQQPIGEITAGLSGVDGLFVDNQKKLYACNFGNGTVTVYPAGATSPSLTLTGAGSPKFVTVGTDGTVYVANFNGSTNGTVLQYDKGQTTPTKTVVAFGTGSFPEGLAIDAHNDLFVAFNKTDGEVLEFSQANPSGVNLGIHVGDVGGLTIDAKGTLYLADQAAATVDVFPAGSNMPSKKITGFALAYGVALNKKNNALYVSTPFNPPSVSRVALPAGTVNDMITGQLSSAFGVATSPDGSP